MCEEAFAPICVFNLKMSKVQSVSMCKGEFDLPRCISASLMLISLNLVKVDTLPTDSSASIV